MEKYNPRENWSIEDLEVNLASMNANIDRVYSELKHFVKIEAEIKAEMKRRGYGGKES